MSQVIYESEWGFRALAPSALTGENGIHIFPSQPDSDNLQIPVGSRSLDSDVVAELLNANQGSYECWVMLNRGWDATTSGYLINNNGSGATANRIPLFFINGTLFLYLTDKDNTSHQVISIARDWNAGGWHHVIATWSWLANTVALYIDGSLADNIPATPMSGDSIDTIASNTQIGEDHNTGLQLNGVIYGRILDRPLSQAEITALYAAGAGSLDSTVVGPDVRWMPLFSDDSTGTIYWHKGSTADNAVDNAGASTTFDTPPDSQNRVAVGDIVAVSDGTGYSKQMTVTGVSSEDVTGDDGAGSAVSGILEVGQSIFCDAAYYTRGGNILNIIAEDFEVDFWLRQDGDPGERKHLISKGVSGIDAVRWAVYLEVSGRLVLRADDNTNDANFYYDLTTYLDNKWHHYHIFIDRSNIASCAIYIDGISVAPTTSGTFPVNTLTNAILLTIGAGSNNTFKHEGYIKDVRIKIGGTASTPAQILKHATNPLLSDGTTWTLDGTREAWKLTEGSGTTNSAEVTSPGNDLTLTNVAAWSQEAYLSKNLNINPGGENQNIGHISDVSIDSTITVSSQTSVVHADEAADEVVFAASNDNIELEIAAPTLINTGDYWKRLWLFPSAMHDNSTLFWDIDGSATPILSREIGKSLDDRGNFARAFNLDATYSATGGNVHNGGTDDICISAWIKGTSTSIGVIAGKTTSFNTIGYMLYFGGGDDVVRMDINDGTDRFYAFNNADLLADGIIYAAGSTATTLLTAMFL